MGSNLISKLQAEHKLWAARNFPDQGEHQAFLGMVEEVGELAHVLLKREQHIREGMDPITSLEMECDAIGDLFIYMMSHCNYHNLDLEYILLGTWDKVKRRDWVADPKGGGE